MKTEEAAPAPSIGRCIYGFALFILSVTCLILFLAWSITPSSCLSALGLHYFSSKYWIIAIPTTCCTLLAIFAICLYPAINMILTPSHDSLSTISDRHSRTPITSDDASSVETLMDSGIPRIRDMDIEYVNELLYD